MFSRAAIVSLIFASFAVIVCITVIWRVCDDLVSDPAKHVPERHEKIDRSEDGSAVWTHEMTFRQ